MIVQRAVPSRPAVPFTGGRPNVDAFSRVVAAHLALDGVIGFDLRERTDGQVFFIESNPRFWFRMDVMALAGLDFVRAALTKESLGQGPPWRLNWLERRVIRELARNPVLPLLELLGRTKPAGPPLLRDQTIVTIPRTSRRTDVFATRSGLPRSLTMRTPLVRRREPALP